MKRGYHWGGFANLVGAIVSHIPCCGSKIIATVFGLQLLGNFSTAYLYPFQFTMPIIAGVILTLFYWPIARRHARAHACEDDCGHPHLPLSFRADIAQFFIVNLIIGYAVVAVLYLAVPPHDHHIITGSGMGMVDSENQLAAFTLPDPQRPWPWRERHFIAHLDHALNANKTETTLIAKELPWYRAAWGTAAHDFDAPGTVTMRLYSRLNGTAVWAALSRQPADQIFVQPPVKFYLVVPTPEIKSHATH